MSGSLRAQPSNTSLLNDRAAIKIETDICGTTYHSPQGLSIFLNNSAESNLAGLRG